MIITKTIVIAMQIIPSDPRTRGNSIGALAVSNSGKVIVTLDDDDADAVVSSTSPAIIAVDAIVVVAFAAVVAVVLAAFVLVVTFNVSFVVVVFLEPLQIIELII